MAIGRKKRIKTAVILLLITVLKNYIESLFNSVTFIIYVHLNFLDILFLLFSYIHMHMYKKLPMFSKGRTCAWREYFGAPWPIWLFPNNFGGWARCKTHRYTHTWAHVAQLCWCGTYLGKYVSKSKWKARVFSDAWLKEFSLTYWAERKRARKRTNWWPHPSLKSQEVYVQVPLRRLEAIRGDNVAYENYIFVFYVNL